MPGNPGDRHWRYFVGPGDRWDTQAALQFVTLVRFGLRETAKVCDVGCGSLRAGRLLIPYLARGNYYGIEPERWLLEDGLKLHVGGDLVALRAPRFITGQRGFPLATFGTEFDYVLAQSVLTHTPPRMAREFIKAAAETLAPGGRILATYQAGAENHAGDAWVYPGCVEYHPSFMQEIGEEVGLRFSEETILVLGLRARWAIWER